MQGDNIVVERRNLGVSAPIAVREFPFSSIYLLICLICIIISVNSCAIIRRLPNKVQLLPHDICSHLHIVGRHHFLPLATYLKTYPPHKRHFPQTLAACKMISLTKVRRRGLNV